MTPSRTEEFADVKSCVDATLARVGKNIVLGLPVGIGKPNLLVNEFVKRALADPSMQLTLFTALSLRAPRGHSDLERRFLEPFVERVFGNYPELEYVRLLERGSLPANIKVNEFFLEPGAWLHNDHLQQHYLSANYTHVARDLIRRGVNVIAQLIALAPHDRSAVSLSSNPDLTVDLFPHIDALRAAGKPFVLIGQVHDELPFMFGDAAVPRERFDMIVAAPRDPVPLFCPPNMPIGATDYLIALNAAALVRDGGTLQLGIGELGDAIVYGLKLRHEQPAEFAAVIAAMPSAQRDFSLIAAEGGTQPFIRGLYGCTEMLVDGFVDLYRAGILKRRVYPHALLQTLLDEQRIAEQPNEAMLQALCAVGLEQLSTRDFHELQAAGVFHDAARFDSGAVIVGERTLPGRLADPQQRAALAQFALGAALRNGVLVHGGFFFGPKDFYKALHDLPEIERRQFAMQRISFVNELYGEQQELKIAQRRHARFVNTTMMVTGLGAAVSDGLTDGRVVSGVGGQYNFVAMAHALEGARSILCVRSTRTSQGHTTSNIVWNYGHVTIPRHLRDIVITEYGIADLRGRTDDEVVEALVSVMDARFQEALVADAKRSGKLRKDYRVPESARANTPERLAALLRPFRARGLFAETPFGSDFTADELIIAKSLRRLQSTTSSRMGRIATVTRAIFSSPHASLQKYLQRLNLDRPASLKEHLEQRLVANALVDVLATEEIRAQA